MAKRLRVPISAARAKLFQLTDLVRTSGDDTVVVLDQRGGVDKVALVREARLAYLEARVAELDKRDERPFSLSGSLRSDLDDGVLEDVLRDIRREWTSRPTPAGTTDRPAKARRARSPRSRPRGSKK